MGDWGQFCISLYYSCPEPRVGFAFGHPDSPELGTQHPGSPGEKANETSSLQRGKHNKLGGSLELVLELPGGQGKRGYLIKQIQTHPLGREVFSPRVLNSQRTFALSANTDALTSQHKAEQDSRPGFKSSWPGSGFSSCFALCC